MDDVLIASLLKEEHIKHVQIVFVCFEKFEVVINPVKCKFGKSEINFLGHYINSAGISPSPCKVEAIENFPVPDTIRKLRQLLGIINFYRRFLPKCAQVVKPLTDMLTSVRYCEIVLSNLALTAFRKILKHIVSGSKIITCCSR